MGDVRSALSRRVNAVLAAQRRYSPAELASPSDWDPVLDAARDRDDRYAVVDDLDRLDHVRDLDEDPYGSPGWWERD